MTTTTARPALATDGLSVAISGVPVVDGVDLAVPQGETLAVVGESGCGKSMTALAIMGLLPSSARITSGRVMIGDVEASRLGERELQALRGDRIAMIFQEPVSSLNPLMRVGAQIAEALQSHRRVREGEAQRETLEMLRHVGIQDPERRARQYPYELSGGMCQRVMIAMALICRPAILIADEPTTALDVTIQAQILELMRRLKDETGSALLLITHDMGVVAEMADRVAVMYAGRVVETAAVRTLFRTPRHPYTRLLLATIPQLDGPRRVELRTIPGTVPDARSAPQGCRFHDRCPLATERCRAEDPPLMDMPADGWHRSACWHWDEVETIA